MLRGGMKIWRTVMNLTQQKAGDTLGISATHIGRLEHGETGLSKVQRYAMQYLAECKRNGVKPKLWDGKK